MVHCPAQVPALAGVPIRTISSGSNQNVAVSRSGELYSWGFGEMGQLCNGRAADEPTPALVDAQEIHSRAVIDTSSGGQHTAVVVMSRPS